jgi:rhodanese-related sulfurtransferase
MVTMDISHPLATTQSGLDRLTPESAWRRMRGGAPLVDIRPEFQRRADGEIPGGIIVERNHLEWRCDPCNDARIPEALDHDVAWIVLCDEGFSSSLAAASLRQLGPAQSHRRHRRLPRLAHRRPTHRSA